MTVTIVLIILSFWVLAKTSEANQRKRAERRRQAEIARIAAEQKRAKQEQREMAKWQAEQEKELMRLAREAEREEKARLRAEAEQQKINEKLEREQAKQAEIIQKHETMILRLQQRIDLAEREISHYQPIADELRAEAKALDFKVKYFESKGLPNSGYRKQLEVVNKKLYSAETKILKAQQSIDLAEKQMMQAA